MALAKETVIHVTTSNLAHSWSVCDAARWPTPGTGNFRHTASRGCPTPGQGAADVAATHGVMLGELCRPEEPLPAEVEGLHELVANGLLLVCHCALCGDDAVVVFPDRLRLNLGATALDIAGLDGLESTWCWSTLHGHRLHPRTLQLCCRSEPRPVRDVRAVSVRTETIQMFVNAMPWRY